MKILITGGDGYIGSNLLKTLGDDYSITLFGLGENYRYLKDELGFSFTGIIGDITDRKSLIDAMDKADVVLHLSATMDDENDRVFYNMSRINVLGTYSVIEACRMVGVNKILFASSYSVYGELYNANTVSITETTEVSPANYYATTKVIGEEMLKSAGISYVITRFTHVYGFGVGIGDFGGILLRFIESALGEGVITLKYGEDNLRDYVHVTDVVQYLHCFLNVSEFEQGIYNVSLGSSVTLLELAQLVADRVMKLTGRKVNVKYSRSNIKRGEDGPFVSHEKIFQITDYRPVVGLIYGIDELIERLK